MKAMWQKEKLVILSNLSFLQQCFWKVVCCRGIESKYCKSVFMREQLLIKVENSVTQFCHIVFKSHLLQRCQKASVCLKWLKIEFGMVTSSHRNIFYLVFNLQMHSYASSANKLWKHTCSWKRRNYLNMKFSVFFLNGFDRDP